MASMLHDRTGYTPFEGMSVTGWPETVLSRGRVAVRDGALQIKPGAGRFLARKAGDVARPVGQRAEELAALA
jgi:dihydropyrimidinase